MTQGQIGAMLQQALDQVLKEAGIRQDIVVMVSHFIVGADEPDQQAVGADGDDPGGADGDSLQMGAALQLQQRGI